MEVFEHPEFNNHENVIFCRDEAAGLRLIIAIHSTRLGPAAGGCRMLPYASEADALTDVLRLSFAMSYKNALARLPIGGGKMVVIGDATSPDKARILAAAARHVRRLGGLYWSSIDVGVSSDDAEQMAAECPYVFAHSSQCSNTTNCARYTSIGGNAAIQAVARQVLQRDNLTGVRIAMQGVGQVGIGLCELLHEQKAEIVIADVNDDAIKTAVSKYGAKAVDPKEIYDQEADIFVPCALGGTLNADTIARLKVRAVCGLANNQLATPDDGKALMDRNIVWAPDYAVNAGGMLGASGPIYGETDQEALLQQVLNIGNTVTDILTRASKENQMPGVIADTMAQEIIDAGPG